MKENGIVCERRREWKESKTIVARGNSPHRRVLAFVGEDDRVGLQVHEMGGPRGREDYQFYVEVPGEEKDRLTIALMAKIYGCRHSCPSEFEILMHKERGSFGTLRDEGIPDEKDSLFGHGQRPGGLSFRIGPHTRGNSKGIRRKGDGRDPRDLCLMKPMPGAVEAFEALSEAFDVYILSTAPWENPSAVVGQAGVGEEVLGGEGVETLDFEPPQKPKPGRFSGR